VPAPVSTRFPASGPASRGVVVLQEAFGITPYIEQVCDSLAAAGFAAAAPHLFHRAGDPVFGYDDLAAAREQIGGLTADGVLADVDAAVAALGLPDARCAVLGFCIGGVLSFDAATRRPFAAAVTFYGGPVDAVRVPGFPPMLDAAPTLTVPWLGLYGGRDAGIPVGSLGPLRDAVPDGELHVYPEAQHGFHCTARPAVFDREAAADGWRRALAFFDRHLPA